MDNETVTDDQFDESDPMDEPENEGLGLAWKVLIAAVAVGVIVFGYYSFVQQQPTSDNESVVNSPAEGQSAAPSPNTNNEPEPTTAEGYFQQGNGYVQTGQLSLAVTAYEKALELNPNYQAVYANLGVVYYQLEQLDLAAQQYQKALELEPNDGEVTYNLGALNLQRALIGGNQPDANLLNEAIGQIQRALELSPNLAEPYFSLGVAYMTLGQKEAAIQAFEDFLANDSGQDPRASQEAQRYLDTLNAQ